MQKQLVYPIILFLTGNLVLAAATPREDIEAAAKKLQEKAAYRWTTTTTVPDSARWRPGPVHGKTAKDGATLVELSFGDNTTRIAMKGNKVAVTDRDGAWESVAELENSEGRERFRATMARNYVKPDQRVSQLLEGLASLEKDENGYSGKLTAEGAKELMRWRSGGDGPAIDGAQGTVKFWLQDGQLVKFQYSVQGVMDWNGNDIDLDRTVTVQIQDIEPAEVKLPEEAKNKMS